MGLYIGEEKEKERHVVRSYASSKWVSRHDSWWNLSFSSGKHDYRRCRLWSMIIIINFFVKRNWGVVFTPQNKCRLFCRHRLRRLACGHLNFPVRLWALLKMSLAIIESLPFMILTKKTAWTKEDTEDNEFRSKSIKLHNSFGRGVALLTDSHVDEPKNVILG